MSNLIAVPDSSVSVVTWDWREEGVELWERTITEMNERMIRRRTMKKRRRRRSKQWGLLKGVARERGRGGGRERDTVGTEYETCEMGSVYGRVVHCVIGIEEQTQIDRWIKRRREMSKYREEEEGGKRREETTGSWLGEANYLTKTTYESLGQLRSREKNNIFVNYSRER